jgi:hypothetical protein
VATNFDFFLWDPREGLLAFESMTPDAVKANPDVAAASKRRTNLDL